MQFQQHETIQDGSSCKSPVSLFPFITTPNAQFGFFNRQATIQNAPVQFISPTFFQNPQNIDQQILGNIQAQLNINPYIVQGRSNVFDSSMNFIALDTHNSSTSIQDQTRELQIPKRAVKLEMFLQKCVNEIKFFCLAPHPMFAMLEVLQNREIELRQTENLDKRNKIQEEIADMYRKLHMFLFGCYKVKDGKKHFDVLKKYAQLLKSKVMKRENAFLQPNVLAQIQDAYNYIFGSTCRNENYSLLLKQVKSSSIKRKNSLAENFMYFLKRYKKNLHQKSVVLFKLNKKIEKFNCCNDDIARFKRLFNSFKKNLKSNS